MAGYKSSVLNDQPSSFWSFDTDRNLISLTIADEIAGNDLIIHNDTNGLNYDLERQSLVSTELSNNNSIYVAENEKVGSNWLDQRFEAIHTTAYDFSDKGQFSVEFLYYKASPNQIRDSGEPGGTQEIRTPIFTKNGVINITSVNTYNGSNTRLSVSVLDSSLIWVDTNNIFDTLNHLVVSYEVVQETAVNYRSYLRLFINGRNVATEEKLWEDSIPNTSIGSVINLCSDGGGDPRFNYATELLILDQVAVYKYALTNEQIVNHYKKSLVYQDFIIKDNPIHYWRLDEIVNPTSISIVDYIGGLTGKYSGSVNRHNPGPEKILNSHCPYFQVGGSAYFITNGAYGFTPILQTGANYSVEFWFNTRQNAIGTLFETTGEDPDNFSGLRVLINQRNSINRTGSIQVFDTRHTFINSLEFDGNNQPYSFNDGNWHHLCVTRTGKNVNLYLDGLLHDTVVASPVSIDKPGVVHLMNNRPGDSGVTGYISEVALYDFALQSQQVGARWTYNTRYRVSGHTLLQGSPVRALVRFYDTITGKLLDQVYSNINTGEYNYHPFNNSLLDVLYKIENNTTVKYRTHGPILPAEYSS